MQTDIALRHAYEKYGCGCHALGGYSKDSGWRLSPRVSARPTVKEPAQPAVGDNRDLNSAKQLAQQASDRVNELSQKIAVLEEALKSNVATTDQNQKMIVDQIVALKAQLAEQDKPIAASNAIPQQTPNSGIRIPGND
jgi:hypothetical protein